MVEQAEQTTIQLYTSDGCDPCHQVKDALETGNFAILGLEGEVRVESIELTEGDNYTLLDDMSIEAIPLAYHGLERCKIFINEETKLVTFDCRPESERQTDERQTDINLSQLAGVQPLVAEPGEPQR